MDRNLQNVDRGGLTMVHLNVASILGANKFDMLKQQLRDSNIDIFCASESWLNSSIPDNGVRIGGYSLIRSDRAWKDAAAKGNQAKKGGGLICYVREGIDYNADRYEHLNTSGRDIEMQWVSLEHKSRRRIVIINIYRPPQGDYKLACKIINEALTKANLKDNVDIFLMGDFNINLNDRKSALTKELEFTTSLWGLKPLIKSNTRFGLVDGKLIESCIDNIFTNSGDIETAKTLDWNFSDHLAILTKRKRFTKTINKVTFRGRSYRNYDRNLLQNGLINADWNAFYNNQSPSDCWELMEEKIRSEINKMCPIKTFKVKEVREPWVTNELLEEIKDKDRALKTAKRSRKAEDMRVAREIRNRVGRMVTGARAEFLKEQQRELQDDPKKFWRLVKSIVPNSKVGTGKISLANEEGDGLKIDDDKVSDHINNFFTSIGPKLAKKIDKCYNKGWAFLGQKSEVQCPKFEADFRQVQHFCRDINTAKSSGIGDISSKVCKDAFLVLVPQLVYMFNLSFGKSQFPDKWKEATIIPLFKGGKKTEVGNYRPISLLPIPGKLLEKVAHANLSKFLKENNILSAKQGGFRKGFSTASTIASLTDDILSNTNGGLTTMAVFIDLKKALTL